MSRRAEGRGKIISPLESKHMRKSLEHVRTRDSQNLPSQRLRLCHIIELAYDDGDGVVS